MNQAQLLDYAQTCLILILKLSLIPIIVATVVGLIVSLLQALTQIQEQTLGFAVKLITISITLMVASSWMGSELLLYTQDIFNHFPLLGR
ncbi:MAG: type III secretion system export apparatus subunit SctS [Victivallales bacterium]|nr:type III secretion system export apparatus subunit SctS [Victivallales bacterium]